MNTLFLLLRRKRLYCSCVGYLNNGHVSHFNTCPISALANGLDFSIWTQDEKCLTTEPAYRPARSLCTEALIQGLETGVFCQTRNLNQCMTNSCNAINFCTANQIEIPLCALSQQAFLCFQLERAFVWFFFLDIVHQNTVTPRVGWEVSDLGFLLVGFCYEYY